MNAKEFVWRCLRAALIAVAAFMLAAAMVLRLLKHAGIT